MKRGSASLRRSARWKGLHARWDSATATISGVPSSDALGLLRARIEGGLQRGTCSVVCEYRLGADRRTSRDGLGSAAPHLDLARSSQWRAEGFLRNRSAVEHAVPVHHRVEHYQHNSHDKDRHQYRIQIAGEHLAGVGRGWPEDILDR